MRTYPHHPSADLAATVSKSVNDYLERVQDKREEALGSSDARFFHRLGQQRVLRAAIEYAQEQPADGVVRTLQSAASEFALAIEFGGKPDPWDMWQLTLLSLATGTPSLAHFLASQREEAWIDLENRSLFWKVYLVRTLFGLLRKDGPETVRWLKAANEFLFGQSVSPGARDDEPLYRNEWSLLSALHSNAGADFAKALAERMDLRAKSYQRHGTNSPLGFLDVEGLGLCRLALDRGIQPALRHVYLPLEILKP